MLVRSVSGPGRIGARMMSAGSWVRRRVSDVVEVQFRDRRSEIRLRLLSCGDEALDALLSFSFSFFLLRLLSALFWSPSTLLLRPSLQDGSGATSLLSSMSLSSCAPLHMRVGTRHTQRSTPHRRCLCPIYVWRLCSPRLVSRGLLSPAREAQETLVGNIDCGQPMRLCESADG